MGRLSELMTQLCPNGVEYRDLSDVLTIRNGRDYKSYPEGDIPVYGSGGIMTYIDTYAYNKPSVLIPRKGSLDKLYYVEEPFWNVDTIFYTEINEEMVCPKFVYYYLQMLHLERLNTAGGVPSLTQAVLNKIKIPVPHVEVQYEIVRILDEYTEITEKLTAELTAELAARQKQYEYYRDALLTFGDVHGGGTGNAVCCRLEDIIISLNTGLNPRQFFKLNTKDAKNYYITIREIRGGKIIPTDKTDRINDNALKLCNNRSNLEVGDILFSGTGTIGETAVVLETPTNWNIKEGVYAIKPNPKYVNSKFLRYLLMTESVKAAYMKKVAGGTVKSIPMGEMRKLELQIPPLEEQERIVEILDRFDALCSDITEGLPAEIEARQKQYEYYRDKLLTFKELDKNPG